MEEKTSEYRSGLGKGSRVPPEIRKWNWGAFFLNWIWGIGNSTYIAFLMFIPLVNFVMPFVLGAKGSEWAWRNRAWRDVAHFKSAQKKWALWGLATWVVFIPAIVSIPFAVMKHTDAYVLALAAIQDNAEVKSALGAPLTPGLFVMGNVEMSGPEGRAALQFSISGPNADGEAYVYAIRQTGRWELHEVMVQVPSQGKRISVVTPPGTIENSSSPNARSISYTSGRHGAAGAI
jgi:Cytochrome oxidase complex assembly protein 1